MEDNRKELITEIREVLSAYEMPYEEGAWETFSNSPKKKRIMLWPWISIAATVLLVSSLWLINQQTATTNLNKITNPENTITKKLTTPQQKVNKYSSDNNVNTPIPQQNVGVPGDDAVAVAAAQLTLPEQTPVIPLAAEAILLKTTSGSDGLHRDRAMGFAVTLPVLRKMVRDTNIKVEETKPDTFMDFLVREKQTQVAKTTPKTIKKANESKWDFGVEVLPTVTSATVNVGAGLSTAYKLSDHFSLGTGVAYTGLGSAVAHKPGISALSSKQLQSVNSSYRAIDIPLNLVYNVNKKVYTSVGVSYINVVEEKATNTFTSEQRQYSFDAVASSYNAGLTTQTTQESAQTQTLKGMGSLGFFNFSVGRKQEVFSKYHISIEPFIKVPVGKLSQQDLKLTNGGMKFKIEF